MRRLVVTTQSGAIITRRDVEDAQLAGNVVAWKLVMPEAGIYIDGELVSSETVRRLAEAEAAALAHAAEPPAPEKLRSYAEIMQFAFDTVRQGHTQSMREMFECGKELRDLWLGREREALNSQLRAAGVRQIGSEPVDMGASDRLTTTVHPHHRLPPEGGHARVGIRDFILGLLSTITGQR